MRIEFSEAEQAQASAELTQSSSQTTLRAMQFRPSRAIYELGDQFYDEVAAASFPRALLRYRNQAAATTVGLEGLSDDEFSAHFHAFRPFEGSLSAPLALRYHGHQFQHYNPQLGDGRGFLFAQLFDSRDRLMDLATKGSGTTPWSRSGDGRLTLKGAVREALATEMLESLGVNTSKTFAIFETGEALERTDEPSPTRAAVLTRLGHSHVRFGTFQRQAAEGDAEALRGLSDYVCRHFYPPLMKQDPVTRVASLLQAVVVRSARLCASWMIAGFVHGVLNTDNMNINGESFDYGPYRFMPKYDPSFTAAYFDREGLYAYGRQPEAVIWNLEQLATSLLLIHPDREPLIDALRAFTDVFNDSASQFIRERLGLEARAESAAGSPAGVMAGATAVAGDEDLLLTVFNFLAQSQITFEQFFFDWYGNDETRAMRSPEAAKYSGPEFEAFRRVTKDWPATASASADYFKRERPCMLLIDEIEAIWEPISRVDDWSKFDAKIEDIRTMGRAHGRR